MTSNSCSFYEQSALIDNKDKHYGLCDIYLILCLFFSKNHHTNPYAVEDTAWQGERADMRYSSRSQTSTDNVLGRIPGGGWQEESWNGRESIPMGYISSRSGSPSWQHDFSKWTRIQWLSNLTWLLESFCMHLHVLLSDTLVDLFLDRNTSQIPEFRSFQPIQLPSPVSGNDKLIILCSILGSLCFYWIFFKFLTTYHLQPGNY